MKTAAYNLEIYYPPGVIRGWEPSSTVTTYLTTPWYYGYVLYGYTYAHIAGRQYLYGPIKYFKYARSIGVYTSESMYIYKTKVYWYTSSEDCITSFYRTKYPIYQCYIEGYYTKYIKYYGYYKYYYATGTYTNYYKYYQYTYVSSYKMYYNYEEYSYTSSYTRYYDYYYYYRANYKQYYSWYYSGPFTSNYYMYTRSYLYK